MLLRLWIGCVAHERDALVHFENRRVQGGRAADVEVEDLGAGLVPDEEEVPETLRDEERVLVAFALEESICSYRRGQADVIYRAYYRCS